MRSWGAFVLAMLGLAVLAGCTPSNIPKGPDKPYQVGGQPSSPALGSALPFGGTRYSNDSLADVFVRLTHDLEWGASRPHLVRYEVPISVGISGRAAGQYITFVDRFLAQLRTRTGIRIARNSGPHNLNIRFVPGNAFRTRVPQNSCLVAPGDLAWSTFQSSPSRYGTKAYESQRALRAMTVFIPDNAEPWLVRICLIEEIIQALGTANDLFGLGPSIFNDDGAHLWPTSLDYLMLRVLYSPELRTGMSRRQTRLRARQILDRLNPQGRDAIALPRIVQRRMKVWQEAILAAFERGATRTTRIKSARQAVTIARRQVPNSAYHCHALNTLARNARSTQNGAALRAANDGLRVCAAAHGASDIRVTILQLERATLLFEAGQATAAFAETRGLERALAAHAQEERLTALYALQAASLRAIQRSEDSFAARRKAAAWGAFALGRGHPDVRRWIAN
ncbi:MAG: DUF2927 domain-containing protein [Pseudomonadota bacterium]